MAPIVLLLAIISFISLIRSISDVSMGGKVYQALLMISLLGMGGILCELRLFSPIFS
ncbi:MAG: hypothetical protein AAGD96_04650 [Chloroflexota bacterium]